VLFFLILHLERQVLDLIELARLVPGDFLLKQIVSASVEFPVAEDVGDLTLELKLVRVITLAFV
jgi:hypothetical protein